MKNKTMKEESAQMTNMKRTTIEHDNYGQETYENETI